MSFHVFYVYVEEDRSPAEQEEEGQENRINLHAALMQRAAVSQSVKYCELPYLWRTRRNQSRVWGP